MTPNQDSLVKHERAVELRQRGYSLSEIHKEVNTAKSTLSLWLRNIPLSANGKARLIERVRKGHVVAAEAKRNMRIMKEERIREKAKRDVGTIILTKTTMKLICALLYWCEGGKDVKSGVRFTNSDPNLVRKFLEFLRTSFEINEAKFRVCLHLHPYHDRKKQTDFWSQITTIPPERFIKPFNKINTGKRVRDGYNGCASVRYHDAAITRELLSLARIFLIQKTKKGA